MDNYFKNKTTRFSRRAFIRDSGLTAAGFLLAPDLLKNGKNSFFQNPEKKFAYLVNDELVAADAAAMQGFISNKLNLSYTNRILAQNVDNLVEPFRHRTETHLWQTEFWGKWFTSAVLAYRYHPTPELKKVLQSAVTGLISTQTPDGYIGNYTPENRLEAWDIWGMKYCMLGLLDYYDLTGDKASLDATTKLADYLIKAINDKDGIIVNKG
ncbi:MAG TPA: beta-L-arabinofuranosidase domain-containing protein, partial [Hanamia sp.]